MQANYQLVGIHRAEVPCSSCKGTGKVQGLTCAVCEGQRTRIVGCTDNPKASPNVEIDLNHPTMAECKSCERLINPNEVTRV